MHRFLKSSIFDLIGWQAVLIPSEDTADVLQGEAGRKGAVLVEVTDIVCDNLEAEVELLHECMENKIVSVPLDELFPIKKQEYEGLNMTSTIVALDLLRFFYKVNNIYYIRINFHNERVFSDLNRWYKKLHFQ